LDWCSTALGEEALTLRNRAGTHVNRGVILMNRRDLEGAMRDFDQAVRLAPALGEAHFNRGSAQIAMGRWSEGLADIDQGLKLGMRQPERAYYNRAIAREELNDTRGAYLDYQEAARLKPDWELPRLELARFTVQRR
jgi:tetratricopeptide (TPR) repeat protein